MNKKSVHILLAIMLTLLLAGCMAKPAVPAETTGLAEETLPAENTIPAAAEESDAEDSQDLTATEAAQSTVPYTLYIPRCDQSVSKGPGFDYGLMGIVREAGTYTIVEEAADAEGNLWGRLASGIGWVDLTQIQSGNYPSDLISVNYADEALLSSGDYHHYSREKEYCIPLAFRAYGHLQDLTLFDIWFQAGCPVPGGVYYSLPELTEEKPLVAELNFPGDVYMYGIRFLDEAGEEHFYSICISGRNAAVILTEEEW